MNIFDLVKAQPLVAYWNTQLDNRPPFLGEELVGTSKQLDDTMRFIKGTEAAPVQLKMSAYDAKAVPRMRRGFETVVSGMPFFKESLYIDERLQKELNYVLSTGDQAYIDSVMLRVMNDSAQLLQGARVSREIMLWLALTTGAISLSSNGQLYTLDYGVPANHKQEVTKSWADETADIIGDIIKYQDIIETDTGVRPTRLVVTRPSFKKITKNQTIKKTVFSAGSVDAYLGENKLREFMLAELGVNVAVYDKSYKNTAGAQVKFIPDDMAVLLPSMQLGEMVFAQTPEESNARVGLIADMAMTDTGVTVTTMPNADPVTVETKVTQVCAPSLPEIDKVMMIDIEKA